jgi:hypothetical protein
MRRPHVRLNGDARDLDAQLEQLPANPLSGHSRLALAICPRRTAYEPLNENDGFRG